jgi:hypothetical protein
MRTDFVVYGPNHWHYSDYFYNENGLQFGHSLNDSDDKLAFGFQVNKTATIDEVGMYIIDIIGACPDDYQLGVVVVSGVAGSTGTVPTDTLYSNSAWQDFDPLTIGSGWSWISLSTPVDATRGDFIAVMIKPGATTPDASNYVEINDESTLWSRSPGQWRYNTSWTRYNWVSPAGIKYNDNSILGWPIVDHIWEEFSSTEEWGLEFQLPVGATCIGSVINLYNSDYDAPFKIVLADSTDTELASLTTTTDYIGEPDGGHYSYMSWDTSTDPILAADTVYRLYLKPTSASTIPKHGFIFNEESDKVSMPGGTDWKMIERPTPASGWTYVTGGYPWLSLLLTDFQGEGTPGGNGGDGGAFGFIG